MYQKHWKARKVNVVYRRRVFQEQARRRNITVAISVDEYSSIVRTAWWYCGGFTYRGYAGVDHIRTRERNSKATLWHPVKLGIS